MLIKIPAQNKSCYYVLDSSKAIIVLDILNYQKQLIYYRVLEQKSQRNNSLILVLDALKRNIISIKQYTLITTSLFLFKNINCME